MAKKIKHNVYRVVKQDGKYVMLVSKRIAIRHSWWHIRHKDGTVTKHNGGKGWYENPIDAWFEATSPHLFSLMYGPESEYNITLDELKDVFVDMWQTVLCRL